MRRYYLELNNKNPKIVGKRSQVLLLDIDKNDSFQVIFKITRFLLKNYSLKKIPGIFLQLHFSCLT
jgi:hypothetical protein